MFRQNGKEKMNSVSDWMLMKKISNGIVLKSNQCVKILEVKPINFELLSESEQASILETYGRFLKQCNIDVQIVAIPFKADVKKHLNDVKKYSDGNEKLQSMMNHYVDFVKEMIGDKHSITRRFFLILKSSNHILEDVSMVIDGLNSCGNEVIECSDAEILELLRIFFRKEIIPNDTSYIEEIYPTFIDSTNPKYMMLDDYYVSGLLIHHYQSEMEGGFLNKIVASDIDFVLSMFYEKKSTYETIKELTSVIGNSGANIKTSGSNQIDIDLMRSSYDNAKYIKKQLQVENDELFDLNIYMMVYADTLEELTNSIRKLEYLIIGCGLDSRRGVFRQEDIFKSCLPIMYHSKEIQKISKRNVLASGLVSTYPFLSNELCDTNGILLGTNALNNSVVVVDRFDSEKYKNANMCVIRCKWFRKIIFDEIDDY